MFIYLLNIFLDSTQEMAKIFALEIIFKLHKISFETNENRISQHKIKDLSLILINHPISQENLKLERAPEIVSKFTSEFKDSLKLPNLIWEKILKLISERNYKISLFALYAIQVLSPRDEIKNLLCYHFKSQSQIPSDSLITFKNEENLRNQYEESTGITFVQISADVDSFFMNHTRLENLHKLIRENIISQDIRYKTTIKNESEANLKEEASEIVQNDVLLNKVDEVNDYLELVKIPDLTFHEESSNNSVNCLNYLNYKQPSTTNSRFVSQSLNMEENLSLEDLGVFEVEHEIFENFDEDNIPVLKNNYKRKKGSAEKLKTNQTARNLLMSNHPNHPNHLNSEPKNESHTSNTLKNSTEEDKFRIHNSDKKYSLSSYSDHSKKENQNIESNKLNIDNTLAAQISNEKSKPTQSNYKSNILSLDEDLLPDKSLKKSKLP
jgi:hypothetical protein